MLPLMIRGVFKGATILCLDAYVWMIPYPLRLVDPQLGG